MRRWISALAATLAVASVGSCTTTATRAEPRTSATAMASSPKACAHGTYEWFNVKRPVRLSAVSDVETLGKGGGKLNGLKHRVWSPKTSVSSHGPALPPRDVLFSLAEFIGEAQEGDDAADMAFTEVGRTPGDPNSTRTSSVDGAGSFVDYNATHAVEADFRYTCRHATAVTSGHATSWTADGSGIFECGTRLGFPKENRDDLAVAREAARLSCAPDSKAAQSPGTADR
ncbi:hypothetical protein [Streptomyces sp. NPDC001068]|uniref:hypothetical protein n=1 Tax=Streptomyces sp. NPDC001068 TaxID=3364544 RepID=UPI003688A3E6